MKKVFGLSDNCRWGVGNCKANRNRFLLLSFLAGSLTLQSCGGEKPGSEVPIADSAAMRDSLERLDREIESLQQKKQSLEDTLKNVGGARWEVGANERLHIAERFDSGTKSPGDLIEVLNRHWEQLGHLPNPVMELEKVKGHTLYVRLLHGERLTQQMGSTGAAQYLAEATFTLTSLPGIDSVHFNFEEGDHARPGSYGRGNWEGIFGVGR